MHSFRQTHFHTHFVHIMLTDVIYEASKEISKNVLKIMKGRLVTPQCFVYVFSILFDFQNESVRLMLSLDLPPMFYFIFLTYCFQECDIFLYRSIHYVLINIHDVKSRDIRLKNKVVRISPWFLKDPTPFLRLSPLWKGPGPWIK
jgi:hypothetical protein